MFFTELASFFLKLEKTTLRNRMVEILAELFKKVSPQEIDKVCYLCLGQLAPKYRGLELNMAEKMMIKVIALMTGKKTAAVVEEYKKSGDLGDVVYQLKSSFLKKSKEKSLTIEDVYNCLWQIAKETGEGSVERKIKRAVELLERLDELSAKFVCRMFLGKLRLGFSEMTILDSLSWMERQDKSLRPILENAFNVLADIGKIAKIFKTQKEAGILNIKSEIGIPIRPAKAERLPDVEKILEKMGGKCALEPKMDGLRCQIHLDKSQKIKNNYENLNLFSQEDQFFVRIFSRNLEDITYMFPDIVSACQKLPVEKAILDGEAIAFNPLTGKFLAFQETIQRKRKHGVAQKTKELPLKVFVFDVLYFNNRLLLNVPFEERRAILEKIFSFQKEGNTLVLIEQKIAASKKEFEEFFQKTAQEGLEGLMAKKLKAVYQAGARNYNWVKYKVAMKSELADTIDCVVMGYYKGKGKRADFGIGAFLVGIWDGKNFLSVSKIGTGLTDSQWREMYKRCQKIKTKNQPKEYQVEKNLFPDVWCLPSLVVEIEADTITKSPVHTAGLALRFPRLKNFRDDKEAWQATTLGELKKLARMKKQS